MRASTWVAICGLLAASCGTAGDNTARPPKDPANSPQGADAEQVDQPQGIALLGNGSHDISGLSLTEIATAADGLATPRDLAFRPGYAGQLWVVNYDDDSVVVVFDAGTADQTASKYAGPGNYHFLSQPASLAFGEPGFMATCQEQDERTQGPNGTPPDFMGPTLWNTDLSVFDGGHASHMDMLHNSPNAVGIAWEDGNAYWVFDGYHASLTRYDFKEDHGPGGADHSDGVVARYVEGEVQRLPNVSSHMLYDPSTELLYVADTGNGRIAVLDTTTGTDGQAIYPNYDQTDQYSVDGAELSTLVDGVDIGMEAPSGLARRGDVLFVSDNANSKIFAFSLEGELVDWVDTELADGSLMGLAFGDDDALYMVDALSSRVLRLAPSPRGD